MSRRKQRSPSVGKYFLIRTKKALTTKKKKKTPGKLDLNFSAHQKDSHENKKIKPQNKVYTQIIYSAKDLHPEHIKSYQSLTNVF